MWEIFYISLDIYILKCKKIKGNIQGSYNIWFLKPRLILIWINDSFRKNRISRLREFGSSGVNITTVPLFNAARTCLQQVMGGPRSLGPLVSRGTCLWWRNVSLRIAAYRKVQSTCHKKNTAREIVLADACFSFYSVFGSSIEGFYGQKTF